MKVSRDKYFAAIKDNCKWGTVEDSQAWLEKLGMGKGDIDLIALVKSWLQNDGKGEHGTIRKADLTVYASHVRTVSGLMAGGARLTPKKCLETLLSKMEAQASAAASEKKKKD